MKIVKHSDIMSLQISPLQYMDWVKEVLEQQYNCIIPPKISIHLPNDGFFNTMPCYIPDEETMGVKVINRLIQNSPALDATIMLYNSRNGELKALMDATMITSMRTGAVAATSIVKLKTDKQINNLSIMGLGVTARATILCLLETLPDECFNIKLLRYKDQAEQFAERYKEYKNATFTIVENYEDLIVEADIIVSCITSATEIIGKNEWFKQRVLLVPVHTRGFQNCDLFFDKVFGDVTGQILGFKNFDKFKQFDEFAKVIQEQIRGRENQIERILVYNIGMALHDIFIADKIMKLLGDNKTDSAELKEYLPKFYI